MGGGVGPSWQYEASPETPSSDFSSGALTTWSTLSLAAGEELSLERSWSWDLDLTSDLLVCTCLPYDRILTCFLTHTSLLYVAPSSLRIHHPRINQAATLIKQVREEGEGRG